MRADVYCVCVCFPRWCGEHRDRGARAPFPNASRGLCSVGGLVCRRGVRCLPTPRPPHPPRRCCEGSARHAFCVCRAGHVLCADIDGGPCAVDPSRHRGAPVLLFSCLFLCRFRVPFGNAVRGLPLPPFVDVYQHGKRTGERRETAREARPSAAKASVLEAVSARRVALSISALVCRVRAFAGPTPRHTGGSCLVGECGSLEKRESRARLCVCVCVCGAASDNLFRRSPWRPPPAPLPVFLACESFTWA